MVIQAIKLKSLKRLAKKFQCIKNQLFLQTVSTIKIDNLKQSLIHNPNWIRRLSGRLATHIKIQNINQNQNENDKQKENPIISHILHG